MHANNNKSPIRISLLTRSSSLILAMVTLLGIYEIAAFRHETVSAAWLVLSASGCYWLAYRFYGRWIAQRALGIDDYRATPAIRHHDGLDYVPTRRGVLFGHHFAAIAGAGPLIGPILAAQMGYLPASIWIVAGVILAGAVQDMTILFFSTRRDGLSLGGMIRSEVGFRTGILASLGILAITLILLAVLALVVVKAMAISPWSSFTLLATLPIALLMGLYLRYVSADHILAISMTGLVLLLMAIIAGRWIANDPYWAQAFTFHAHTLGWALMVYAVAASVLPVWLLLTPRDYLSTFLKIGTIITLALGILWVQPNLQMPMLTRFIDGTGPVFSGKLFPFLFITIACGAVSGFHALVSSGTTPRMIERESHIAPIGYGAMLTESAVAMMALVSACMLAPGLYFAMNSPAGLIGHDVQHAAQVINSWGFQISPEALTIAAHQVGEQSLLSRVGGAPTLAYGLATIMSRLTGPSLMAFWYHFAVLFEALFILTTVDAGTRVGRFLIQDLLGLCIPRLGNTRSWLGNILATLLFVAGWGYFLLTGIADPLGGIHTLWPLFGIANQMLAGMALMLGCVILIRMQRQRYVWIPGLPAVWVLTSTLYASWLKISDPDPHIGFLAQAHKLQDAFAAHRLLPPASSLPEMQAMIHNAWIDTGLCSLFALIVLGVCGQMLLLCFRLWTLKEFSAQETPAEISID